MNPLLDIHDLTFGYNNQPVLQNVNLSIQPGMMLSVIGPNGGGKTTLLKLILGLLKPDSGTLMIDGLSAEKAVRTGTLVGYLPQQPTLNSTLPIDTRTFVRLGLAGRVGLFHSYPREDVAFVDWLIDRVQLTDVARRPLSQLSGGQQQRALIAHALAPRPKLLVLDEPTIGIDANGQKQFESLVALIRKEMGISILMVTHDLRVAMQLSDRIACVARTIHFHDLPGRLPAELAASMFNCDVAALRLLGPQLTPQFSQPCNDPVCDGTHVH